MKKFAQGISFYKLLWIFIIGSVIGAWYEEILIFVISGSYQRRSALVIGPFNTLYGYAYVLAILLLNKVKRWNLLILYGALIGGTVEYLASFLQETITGTRSWDYSNLFLNIDGRTTIPFALFWGILIYLMVSKGYPWLSHKIESVPLKWGKPISLLMTIFLALNIFVSTTMMIRRSQRINNQEPQTLLGEFYDFYFTDERILQLYPNLEFLKSTK